MLEGVLAWRDWSSLRTTESLPLHYLVVNMMSKLTATPTTIPMLPASIAVRICVALQEADSRVKDSEDLFKAASESSNSIETVANC